MKKSALTILFLLISATSSSVLADNDHYKYNNGGYTGPGNEAIPRTVAAAKNVSIFSDDVPTVLTGVIVHSNGDEMYTFRDQTGEISVEIDHDKWWGLSATPNTVVVIEGEVDVEIWGRYIDVNRIHAK